MSVGADSMLGAAMVGCALQAWAGACKPDIVFPFTNTRESRGAGEKRTIWTAVCCGAERVPADALTRQP